MKTKLTLLIACLFIITSCSINSNDNNDELTGQIVTIEWHLTNVTGGIAGVDNQFALESIIWSFDADNGKIKVVNNNTDDTIEDGLDSDTYDYDFYEEGNDSYIIINGEEYGKFTYSETDKEITIDQNQNSSVTLSDLYILKLTRKVIVTDVVIN